MLLRCLLFPVKVIYTDLFYLVAIENIMITHVYVQCMHTLSLFCHCLIRRDMLYVQRPHVLVMTAILWTRARANAPLNTFAPMDALSARMAALATQLEPDVTVPLATPAPTAKHVRARTSYIKRTCTVLAQSKLCTPFF